MAGTKISDAVTTAPTATDMIPFARTSDSTARHMTSGALSALSGVGALSAAAAVTDTDITVQGLPDGFIADLFWVVIDPCTVECEVRKITSISTNVLSFSDALSYAHAIDDAVFFITDPTMNVKWFGAVGDGSTNDETALHRCFTQAGLVDGANIYVPEGMYMFTTQLEIPNNTYLIGDGYLSELKANAAISMIAPVAGSQRYCGIKNIRINGNGIATVGIDLDKASSVLWNFSNISIANVSGGATGTGIKLYNVQNTLFNTIHITNCDIGVDMLEGVGGSTFSKIHVTHSTVYHLHMKGTSVGVVGNNLFAGCWFEASDSVSTGVYFEEYAKWNTFLQCIIAGSSVTASDGPALKLGITSCDYNRFISCKLLSNALTGPMIENKDEDNVFDKCLMRGWSGTYEFLWTYAPTHIWNCDIFAGGVIKNKSGNIYDNVDYIPLIKVGATPTAMGDHIGTMFYDMSFDNPMFYDGTNWKNALGGIGKILNLDSANKKTIASGAIDIGDNSIIKVEVESPPAADNLDTINGGAEGDFIVLKANDGAETVTVRHNVGNIYLKGFRSFDLDNANKYMLLFYDTAKWYELSFSFDKQTEITDELTAITHTAPGTPDYAIQNLTATTPFGFVTQDEGNTLLKVVANLQTRQNALETVLVNLRLLSDAD